MAQRVQSPSSLNTFKQCPRKYYYTYIEKRPTKPSIHTVRGTVVHEALENFFAKPVSAPHADKKTALLYHLLSLAKVAWLEHDDEVTSLGLTAADLTMYKEETGMMLLNWLDHFWETVTKEMNAGLSFEQAFTRHTPRLEEEYKSHELQVRGYIDAIHERDGEVHIRDYKTSKKPEISPEYRLQLGVYALLYKKTHNIIPNTVGIFFLKHKHEALLEVNDELIREADLDIKWVHERTVTNDINEYPKRPQVLCKWCDFYDLCYNQRSLGEY